MDDLIDKKEMDIFRSVKTVILTFIALIGFLVGAGFVLWHRGAFHEIEYQPEVILDSVLSVEDPVINPCLYQCVTDSAGEKDTILHEIRYRRYLLTQLSDSVMEKLLFTNQLIINKDSFDNDCLIDFSFVEGKVKKTQPILWDYYITYSLLYNRPMTPYHLQKNVRSTAITYRKNIDFFTEYPGFVLWALLIILQFSLFPVLMICGIVVIKEFREEFPLLTARKKRIILWDAILSGTILISFVLASYFAFFNPNLITNGLFYKKMTPTLLTLSGLAGLVGLVCFTGFMLISGFVINDKNESRITETNKSFYIHLLNGLNSLFLNLLIIASLVLCTLVLTTGVLYTSINNMKFIGKITDDMGYSPFSYHYVLLIGSLSTILLLLFFVPAKLRLVNMDKCIKRYDPQGNLIERPPDLLGVLKSILVIGLPILTGVLHFLFNLIANHH